MTQRLAVPGLLEFSESQRKLGLFALKDGTTCGGKPECHSELGRQLEVGWLVLVSVSQIAQDQSLALELFNVGSAQVLERESVLLPRRGEVPAAMLDDFARAGVGAGAAGAGGAQAGGGAAGDHPAAAHRGEAAGASSSAAEVSRGGGIVLGAVAVAAVGAGVGLLVNGLSLQAKVKQGAPGEDGRVRSELSGSQAKALNDSAGLQLGLAAGAGALGLALGVIGRRGVVSPGTHVGSQQHPPSPGR